MIISRIKIITDFKYFRNVGNMKRTEVSESVPCQSRRKKTSGKTQSADRRYWFQLKKKKKLKNPQMKGQGSLYIYGSCTWKEEYMS